MSIDGVPSHTSPRPARVQLLVTCLVDRVFPETGMAVARTLERLGIEVIVPAAQTCCGQPAFNAGYTDDARAMARHTIDVLLASPDPIVIPSGSCGDMVIHQYAALFAERSRVYRTRADARGPRTYEFTQFLVDVLGVTDLGAVSTERLAYHACCHGLRGLNLRDEPRALLAAVGGAGECPLAESDVCCGFGGLFSVKMADISSAMLDRKLDRIEESGADAVVVTDVSCGMHMAGGLRRRGSRIRIRHIADVLAPHWCDSREHGRRTRLVREAANDELNDGRSRHVRGSIRGRARATRGSAARCARSRAASSNPDRPPSTRLPESDRWRDHARRIRAHTLARLDTYLDQFTSAVEANGGHVYYAHTAADAVAYVRDLAAARGVKLAVKSKSMISEEIDLNEHLESAGVRVVETDLGEYVVQLSHDHPSHIVMPIIHRTKEEVADLFRRTLDATDEDVRDVASMTGFVRRVLRPAFIGADLGVSGVNFGVAETGSICICTNEGNGRLVTTMPRIHVAMMGIERLVPTMDDLGVMLQVLARSATGQNLTVYTNVVTGPKRTGEPDGPEEFHVVLLDNGRSRVLGSEVAEILYCIRCGACLNACPVYQQIGGHAYGSVYPGPVGSVLTPGLRGLEHFARTAAREQSLRRLPRRVPGAHRHSEDAAETARARRE